MATVGLNEPCVYLVRLEERVVYVGMTVRSLKYRMARHRNEKRCKAPFQRAIAKYGFEAFEFLPVFFSRDRKTLGEMEVRLIEEYETRVNGYNVTAGGEGALGFRHKDSTKAKLSKIAKARKIHPRVGTKHTDESRVKMSCSAKKREPRRGWNHSDEACQKIREAALMRPPVSEAMRQARSRWARKTPVVCNELGVTYESIAHASRILGVHSTSIAHCLSGKLKRAGGYTFRRAV